MTAAKPPRPTPRDDYARGLKAAPANGIGDRAFDVATDASERFNSSVEASPLAVLAGGVALGLVAGAMLPKTQIEGQYLGPLGQKLNAGVKTAGVAAVEAGKAELAANGLSRVGASEQVGKLLEGVGTAVRSATDAARNSRKQG